MNTFKRYAADLRKAQQAMSRKKKFSNNWKKAKATVQRIHVRIANARRDYLHKTSTAISKNHAMVVVEDLQVQNMSRSASGTVEQPGRKVRAKAGLSRDNRKSQAAFACVKCGFADHADLVGAINILRAGYARIACEVNGGVSRQQQEPTERAA